MSDLFAENYVKWEKKALREFKNSEYWNDDYDSGHLEITEDGSIYLGNLHWINGAVTSWKDSKYYNK